MGPVEGRVGRDGLLVDGAVVVVVDGAVVMGVQHRLVGLEVVEGGRVAVGVQGEPVSLLSWKSLNSMLCQIS